ncbi:MAG: hypothetical protein HQ506_04100 [Candidatus Marinimicrobia bacterium]|nr:hypothetical protein [Candidatus Neomarinimicrobiota bacterium]
MQILLTHALRSEAGSIRQHYPLAKPIRQGNGQELIQLDKTMHILRTGVGLESSEAALNAYINPKKFDLIVHFGVSGSLSDNLPLLQIIKGTKFSCAGKPDLKIASPEILGSTSLPEATFYSSAKAITDEIMRESAISSGAQAVDMESYSVAVFCENHSVPLLAIRCISDRAGHSTPEDFKKYYTRASQTLQNFLLKKILLNLL